MPLGPNPCITTPSLTQHAWASLRRSLILLALGLLATLGLRLSLHAQPASEPIPPADLNAPFADPLVDFPGRMTALRVTAWDDGPARMLLLEGDASFQVGVYGFSAPAIVVRVETQTGPRGPVQHLAAYFQNAQPLTSARPLTSTQVQLNQDPRKSASSADPAPTQAPAPAEDNGLLVTASTTGAVRIEEPGHFHPAAAPPGHPLIAAAQQRLRKHRESKNRPGLRVPLTDGPAEDALIRRERRRAQIALEQRKLYEQQPGQALAQTTPPAEAPPPDAPPQDILPARGAVAYSTDGWSFQLGPEESTLSLVGNVTLVFEDYRDPRVVTLRAQRVVLFIANDPDDDPQTRAAAVAPGAQINAGSLRGVYLEDNAIVSDGQYTVRSPRVFYDLARNRATLLDAVFYTYDTRNKIPLYLRAEKIRQTAANDFSAENARLTTSEFATPHFSIGAAQVTVEQYRRPDGQPGQFFQAKDTTLNVGKTPVFYWPYLSGVAQDASPLRSVRVGTSSDNGVDAETTWDLFALLGKQAPAGIDAEANIDFIGEHGAAIGANGVYDTRRAFGNFLTYFLFDDSGEDEVGGRVIPQDDEQRGVARFQHRQLLPANFSLSAEGAFVSDPTFLEEFYPNDAAQGKEYETSGHLQYQENDRAFDLLINTNLSGFTEQLPTLQAEGFNIERFPELASRVIGGELFGGNVTYFGQTTFTQLRILAGDDAPEDRGFSDADSLAFFGINADVSFRDRLDLLGLPSESIRRLDSRHELSLPLAAGPIDITPYTVGRITLYDQDFSEFNGGNGDQIRVWGEGGLRLGTEFSRAAPDVRSPLLDVNGIRHIVEPSLTFFANATNLDAEDLPAFDDDIEDLAEGFGLRLGAVNTLQTRRGGPGRERTVDWLTLRTDFVFRGDDADVADPIPRYVDYRPEYSVGGDHFYGEMLWMVTDTLGVTGEVTNSFESGNVVQWRLGSSLDHTPRLNSFVNYEEIDVLDSRLLTWGFAYDLTAKYRVGFQQIIDFEDNDTRQIDFIVDRKLPQWTLRVKVGFDEIDDEETVGLSLIPDGRSSRRGFGFN
ncbi:MAG: LPS assembly protein LptD [Planctomycetota bacterium]